jgi:hypothetical protein
MRRAEVHEADRDVVRVGAVVDGPDHLVQDLDVYDGRRFRREQDPGQGWSG